MRLADRAITVRLTISAWSGMAVERGVARDGERKHGAKEGTVKARKVLMPDFPELIALQKFNTEFRSWFNQQTLAYDDGVRLYPVIKADTFYQEVGERERTGEALADAAALKYPHYFDCAKASLGTLFEEKLYPSVGSFRSKFGYKFVAGAIPDSDQLRNFEAFDKEEVERLIARANEAQKEQLGLAFRDMWQRVFESTNRMAERLAVPAGEPGGKFHDTLVSNIADLVTLLPKLNVFDDEEIAKAVADMKALSNLPPEALRNSPEIRADRAAKAKALAERARSYL